MFGGNEEINLVNARGNKLKRVRQVLRLSVAVSLLYPLVGIGEITRTDFAVRQLLLTPPPALEVAKEVRGISVFELDHKVSRSDLSFKFKVDEKFEEKVRRVGSAKDYLSESKNTELKQRYVDMSRNYNMKEKYGLLTLEDRRTRVNEMEDFARFYTRNIIDHQIEENLKAAEENSEEVRVVRNVQHKVEQIMNGETNVSVSEDMKFGARTDLPNQSGNLFFSSGLVNAAFNINLATEVDRYSLSANRDLIFGLKSDVRYGTSSRTLNTTVSKQLAKNLSATFAHEDALKDPNESLRLNYGFSF